MKRHEIFSASIEMFNSSDFRDEICGFLNWEIYDENNRFKLECWNHNELGPVIVQFWPDGNGYSVYSTHNFTQSVEIKK